jgi:hypothetical protein
MVNVGKLCIKDGKYSKGTYTGGYNTCYNEMALKAHNQARRRHEGFKPLALDATMATAIQKVLDGKAFTGSITAAARGAYSKCGQNMFMLSDLTKSSSVYLENVATKAWYAGSKQYDVATGQPKAGSDSAAVRNSDQFVNILWKGTTKVAFGVKGQYVAAWYCEVAATPRDGAATLLNVGKTCNTEGYDSCYNDLQTKFVNVKRKHHETAGLKHDPNAARAIQAAMNRGSFRGIMPAPADRDPTFAGCAESVFYERDATKRDTLSVTDRVTQAWYSGMSEYDFKTNQPKQYPADEYMASPGECVLSVNSD